MKLKIKKALIANAAEAYKHRHYRDGWFKYQDLDPEVHYKQLLALPDDATEEQMIAIIGDNILTQNTCDECGQDVEITVMLGEKLDYESNTAWICPKCLKRALRIAEEASS